MRKFICLIVQTTTMNEISRTYCHPKDVDVSISQISDGIYRIAGFVKEFGITFNQFLVEDDNPTLIHTGPIGMYPKIEEKVKEVIKSLILKNFLMLPSCTLRVMNGVE